ncbi:MAG TPA: cbb3-type cytochrome oxidase assembly protein CcoS [Candidatus Paceibacterota bacterium]|nr:cbb3-type cytochrome oxidase assembly protein CcoS [Candidatus Paceibacterota bacterium]
MSVVLILIIVSLTMALLFLGGFIWAVRSGQFEDTLTPSMRVLADEGGRPVDGRNKFRKAGGTTSPPSALRSETGGESTNSK